jgi:hypothetical protein
MCAAIVEDPGLARGASPFFLRGALALSFSGGFPSGGLAVALSGAVTA